MGGEDNELTLQALARRLEALERENAELRREVAKLAGSDTSRNEEPASDFEGRVSRKWLLSRAGAAAAGLVMAGALTQRDIREARAATVTEQTTFQATAASRGAVEGSNLSVTGYGVWGNASLIGVRGTGLYGVSGESSGATGTGVQGNNSDVGNGVMGDSQGGAGVRGRSFGGDTAAVVGEHFARGYGGQFKGGRAQLRLVPGDGKPRGAHSKGEIYMDSNASLFVCIKSGIPGTWRKVATKA